MDVNDILTRFRTDPEFAAKYTNLNDINAVQSQLKSDGYDVSIDDIRAGIGQLQGGELSEADLAGVVGGAGVQGSGKKCEICGSKNLQKDYARKDGGNWWKATCRDCGHVEYLKWSTPE